MALSLKLQPGDDFSPLALRPAYGSPSLRTPDTAPRPHGDAKPPRLPPALQQHPDPEPWGGERGVPSHPTEQLRTPPGAAQRLPGLSEPTASGTELAAP